ncbi:hypothetical protein B0H34DRAFT_800441 [Crassisporium funariophilum]|nr:hypothetical protein B0H34DRAFT_800441 [Crassisporium funariophilum]
MKTLLIVVSALLGGSLAQTGLAPKKFLTIPLGNVKPSGWLMDQLKVQTNGLAGHEHEFYNYVSQTDWVGGTSLYSNLEEGTHPFPLPSPQSNLTIPPTAGSYWFNAMVPNGILVNSTAINAKTSAFLQYVLSHQDSTGWLGPEVNTTKPRYLWGRYPFMFGAIQMAEHDPTLLTPVVTALHKFVALANTMMKTGQGLEPWTETRWEDFVMVLQWLYDNHPDGQEAVLLDTMKQLKWTGVPWEKVFSAQYFPKTAVENTPNPFNLPLTWHGVNMAEGLKALPATYRFTHNQSDLDAASKGWDLLFQYHGRPSGIFAADEYLAGLEAVRGTELCLVVETMFSGSFLYQVIGDPKFADRVERITYNALPATLTGDMWSRQYLQQQNQIASKNMNPNPFPNDGAYSNVFGLEPNYPCCTVNHPQGWPKFISNAFLTTPDQTSLVHLYLGPFETSVTLASGNAVKAVVDTQYPFSDVLTTTITATKAFTYFVRIPGWVVGGTIAVNGAAAKAVAPVNGLQAVAAAAGTTKFVLNLPAPITTDLMDLSPSSEAHCITHSTVSHFSALAPTRSANSPSLPVAHTQKVLSTNAEQPLARDLQFDATANWQYAIDPATLAFTPGLPTPALPSPVFDTGKAPLSISVSACPISWPTAGDTFVSAPPTNPACVGAKTTLKLSPYGATKLRIGEFPVFKSG